MIIMRHCYCNEECDVYTYTKTDHDKIKLYSMYKCPQYVNGCEYNENVFINESTFIKPNMSKKRYVYYESTPDIQSLVTYFKMDKHPSTLQQLNTLYPKHVHETTDEYLDRMYDM